MIVYDLIEKKKNKKTLTKEEINFVVNSFVENKITDAEMSSLLMAIVLNGMNDDETFYLTKAMQNSGQNITFDYPVVDKHSTGGVGDSTTLIIVPILACLGVKIAKMSGRSLGFTGGTIDKVEMFDGYQADKSIEDFKQILEELGGSIISQTKDVAVADKKIYALRDKTCTVESIPLIASSIMSKKLACGSSIILLDVKYGTGAFMKNKRDAIKLGRAMVKLGKMDNKKVVAYVTDMNCPLGNGIGCIYEVEDVIDVLKGKKDTRLYDLSRVLALELLRLDKGSGEMTDIDRVLESGDALTKLASIIEAHKGDSSYLVDKSFGQAKNEIKVISQTNGYVNSIDAYTMAKVNLRLKNEDIKDNLKKYQGITINKPIGSKVVCGEILATIHSETMDNSNDYKRDVYNAFVIKNHKPTKRKLVAKIIR